MLALLILLPIVFGLLIALAPSAQAKLIGVVGTFLQLGVFLIIALYQFDWSLGAMQQLKTTYPWLPQFGIELSMGVDSIAMLLLGLTAFLGPILVISSFSAVSTRPKTYYAWLLVLQGAMAGVFCARDAVLFYVFFEFTLVPLYMLISLYGSSNRKAAATKFFLYTFTGSLITLAGVVFLCWWNATQVAQGAYAGAGGWTFSFQALESLAMLSPDAGGMPAFVQTWVFAALIVGFAVKVPLFPFHTWLPLAHTEAPTAGSVVLAGVLLKLGTYGMYRFCLGMTPLGAIELAPVIAVLAIIGIVYAGLVCWVQRDVKKLVAYSSVSHLGFCVLGLFALNSIGLSGSVLYMINHGLSTGALFLLIGMVYERYHTRSMGELGGLAKRMPVWSSFMVFFAMASVGLPGLNGFVSEFMCLLGAFQSGAWTGTGSIAGTVGDLGPWFAAFAALGLIVTAIYILYMVGKVVWGELREPQGHSASSHDDHALPTDLNAREIGVLIPLAVACLFLGLYPTPVLRSLEAPTRAMAVRVESAREHLAVPPVDLATDEAADAPTGEPITLRTTNEGEGE